MSNNLIYQTNVPFEPAPVASSAPVLDNIVKRADEIQTSLQRIVIPLARKQELENKYSLGAKINDTFSNAYIKSLQFNNPHDQAAYFNSVINDNKNTILSQALPSNQSYANDLFQYHLNNYNVQFAQGIARYNGQLARAKYNEVLDSYQNQMANNAYNNNQTGALIMYGQAKNILDKAAQSGLNPVSVANQELALKKSLYTQTALGEYNIAVKNGTGLQYRKDFDTLVKTGFGKLKDVDQVLDPTDISSIKQQFNTIDNQYKQASGFNAAQWDDQEKSLIFSVQRGEPVDMNIHNQLMESNPAKAQQLNDDLQDAHQEYMGVNNGVQLTPIELDNYSDKINQQLLTTTNYRQHKILTYVSNQLNHFSDMAKNDPATYITFQNAYQNQLNKAKQNPNFNKYSFILNYEKSQNITPQLLSTQTAKTIANTLNNIAPLDMANNLMSVLSPLPTDVQPVILDQLKKQGLHASTQYLWKIYQSDPQYYSLAANAFSKKNINDFAIVKNGLLTKSTINGIQTSAFADDNYIAALQSGMRNPTKSIDDYMDTAKKLALQMVDNGEFDYSHYSNSLQKATTILTNGLSFDDYQGHTYLYPSDIKKDLLNRSMQFVLNEVQNSNIAVPKGLEASVPGLNKQHYNKLLLSSAYFAVAKDQHSLVLIDSNKNPILDDKGNQFIIPFDQLKSGRGDFVNKMAKYYVAHKAWAFGINPKSVYPFGGMNE